MFVVDFDPVLVRFGNIEIRWYGLMYVWGFIISGQILKKLSREKYFRVEEDKADVFLTYMLVSMFLGARFFYVFIYNWNYYSQNLTELFSVWKGGLSFHGALTGMCVGLFLFARKYKLHYFEVADVLALSGSQGLFWGRIGNFINGELYGRVTTSPFGMVFKNGGPMPRHPSMLYEGFFEGIVLSLIIWSFKSKVKFQGALGGIFLMGYAFFRYFIEFFRQPDAQLGYYFGGTTTMGQILCFIMFLAGASFYLFCKYKNRPALVSVKPSNKSNPKKSQKKQSRRK